jgi:hypothetical protein
MEQLETHQPWPMPARTSERPGVQSHMKQSTSTCTEAHLGLGPLGRHLDFRAKTKYLGVEYSCSANTRSISISISTAPYSDKDVADAMGIVLGNPHESSRIAQHCSTFCSSSPRETQRGTDRNRQASPLCPPLHRFKGGLIGRFPGVTARQRAGSEAQPTNQPPPHVQQHTRPVLH